MASNSTNLRQVLEETLRDLGVVPVRDIREVYNYHPTKDTSFLGSGGYGRTYMMKSRAMPGEPERAVKIIPKATIVGSDSSIQHICVELCVATRVQHPNLNRAVAAYHSDSHLYIVLEMCAGPTPDIRTRLYHLFARHKPSRIPEVEALATKIEAEAKAFIDEKVGPKASFNEASIAGDHRAFIDEKVKLICKELQGPHVPPDVMIVSETPTRMDLCDLIILNKALPGAKAAVILKQCLLGLESLHVNRIVHRDVKPENIIIGETRTSEPIRDPSGAVVGVRLTEKMDVKIIDFGLVKQLEADSSPSRELISDPTSAPQDEIFVAPLGSSMPPPALVSPPVMTSPHCGTPSYMPLEAIRGSLGCRLPGMKWTSTLA
jgi:serine/threonine protein kinase